MVRIGLQGKEYINEELPPSNLTFLIDVSGSMDAQNKLSLLKSAYTNATDLEDVLKLAESGRGSDQQGYRAEFIRLVKTIGNDMAASK